MLSAHYDSVPASPGAGDDGAGVAVLIEAAAKWAQTPAKNSLILLINDGEELGLLGADAFMSEHPLANDVRAVLNLEARGSSGPAWMFEMGPKSRHLLEAFAASTSSAYTSSIAESVYALLSNATDVDVYSSHQLPSLNFAFLGEGSTYHTAHDDLAHLSERSVQSHTENILGLLDTLRDAELQPTPSGAIVFFDLLGWLLILPIASMWCAGLGVMAGCACYIRHKKPLAIGQTLASWVGYLFGNVVVGLVTVELFNFSSQAMTGWASAPRASAIALFVALVAWTSEWTAFNQRRPRASFILTLATGYAGLTLITLVLLPAASYLFAIPAVGALCALGIHHQKSEWYPQSLLLIFCATALVWAPVVGGLYAALDLNAAPLLALCFAVAFSPLAPLLPPPTNQSRSLALLPAALALTLILIAVPSAKHNPRPINLVFVNNSATDEARLAMISTPDRLPPQADELGQLRDRARLVPWSQLTAQSRVVGEATTGPALFEFHSAVSTPARHTTIQGLLRTPSGASVVGLAFPETSGIDIIFLDGEPQALRYTEGWASLRLHGYPNPAQIRFSGPKSDETVLAFAVSYVLPEFASTASRERDRFGIPFGEGDRSLTIQLLSLGQDASDAF
jgi:hypothetical protein